MIKFLTRIAMVYILSVSVVYSGNNEIQLPKDYKSTFTNYISNDRVQNPNQIIRLFANEIAMQGPSKDGKLPYGSILVGEIYKAKKDKDGNVIISNLNRRVRGKLALIAVMQREQGFDKNVPKGLRNDGWDFAAYKPNGSAAGKDLNSCRACHAPLTDTNHLFSYEHLVK